MNLRAQVGAGGVGQVLDSFVLSTTKKRPPHLAISINLCPCIDQGSSPQPLSPTLRRFNRVL